MYSISVKNMLEKTKCIDSTSSLRVHALLPLEIDLIKKRTKALRLKEINETK